MSNQRPIYLLAGGRGSGIKKIVLIFQAVFKEIGKPVPTIAYVGVASDDNWMFYQMIGGMIKKAGKCNLKRITICSPKADLDQARLNLTSADAVFMSGGDVERGMEVLQKKNLVGFLQDLYTRDKVFFGASAGSIMLAREWVRWRDPEDDSTAELFPCLGLAQVICDTHAEEDDWEELKAALRLKPDRAQGYGIPSEACLKVYSNSHTEALGDPVSCYIRQDSQIVKLPDLEPLDR
jgi:cyanophycinase-like exopeptidase